MLVALVFLLFFFKQKTAYEMRISDWSSDVCSSDLLQRWESVPLGPFTAKSFATQISLWVIPIEALLPYGHKTETQATAADYLRHEGKWTFDIGLEVHRQSAEMRRPGSAHVRIKTSNHTQMNRYPDTTHAPLTVHGERPRHGTPAAT